MNMTPTEAQEQVALVQYFKLRNIPHFRVPNETYTKSFRQKQMNRALGVSSGVPDLFVIVGKQLIAIEMKRKKGSVTSDNQKIWLSRLNEAGIPARICFGADQAITFIQEVEAQNATQK